MSLKYVFYDWFGFNTWLFWHINASRGATYDSMMLALTELGNHDYFHFYVIATAAVLAARLCINGINRPWPVIKQDAKPGLALLITMVMGFMLCALATGLLKGMFGMPRPSIVHKEGVHLPGGGPLADEYYTALPSGHATTIGFLVAAWWPHLPPLWRKAALLLAFLVCWSRVAVGMHSPADVAVGVLLGAGCAIITRRYVYRMMRV